MYLNDTSAKAIYRFDTNPASATYGTFLTPLDLKFDGSGTTAAPRWTDMAVSPINEGTQAAPKYYIYAAGAPGTGTDTTTASGTTLYKIDPDTGAVTTIGAVKLADANGARTNTNPAGINNGYPMQYFDQNGYFYFTAGTITGGKVSIYRLDTTAANATDKTTAVDQKFSASSFPNSGDAARIVTISLDYGNAPDGYKTSLAQDGARHNQVGNSVWLGDTVAADKTANITDGAVADNDGVTLGALLRGVDTYSAEVKVHGGSVGDVLIGWIDFDGNNAFDQREAASVTLTQEMVDAGKATLPAESPLPMPEQSMPARPP